MALVKFVRIGAPAVTLGLIAACGSSESPSPSQSQAGEQQNAEVSFQTSLPAASFAGNSVEICGVRTPDADAKYRCFNDLGSATAGVVGALGVPNGASGFPESTPTFEPGAQLGCPCFQFNADGSLVSVLTGFDDTGDPIFGNDLVSGTPPQVVIPNLCPSNDVPEGDWTFTYAVWTGTTCGTGPTPGEALTGTGNPNNFVCYDSRDLATLTNPNETTGEPLDPGQNSNHIVCSTVNATKTFDFTSCALSCGTEIAGGTIVINPANPPAQNADGTFSCMNAGNVFECGCTGATSPETLDACACGENGFTSLPDGCTFGFISADEPCAIICTAP